jgi:Domain of unknown function (DUF202)
MSSRSRERPPPPGGQPERTRLAWRRTMLTATAVALLAARLAAQDRGGALPAITTAAVIAAWLGVLVVSWRRITALSVAAPAPVRRAVPLATLAAIGFAGLGVVLVTGR